MATILIVDDSSFARRYARVLLESQFDCTFIEAANGEEAVSLHAEHQPIVTLLDLQMPVLDGISAMKQILQASPAANIVILCAGTDRASDAELLALGASQVVQKPLDDTTAHALISAFLTAA